jgi:hypothetical protein
MCKMTPAYKASLIGGFAVIVGTLVALGMANPTGEGLIFPAIGMVAVFLAGIFWFQWRMKNTAELEMAPAPGPDSAGAADGSGPPADYRTLMAQLPVVEVDAAAQRRARDMTGVVRSQISFGAVLSLFIVVESVFGTPASAASCARSARPGRRSQSPCFPSSR